MNKNIQQNLAASRLWGDKYSIGTSEDAEVLLYLMSVVYGTRNFQSKINGCVSLYSTNLAVAAGLANEAAVVCNKGTFEPGMVLKGTVRNVVDFGCFVDIGVHHDGLLHISEMSDRFVKKASDLFAVGDVIEVRIKDVDKVKSRIALSRKGMADKDHK